MINKINIELIPDFGLPANTFVVCGDFHHPELMHSLTIDDLDAKTESLIKWYKANDPKSEVGMYNSHLVGHYNRHRFLDDFKELIGLAVIKYPQSKFFSKLNDFSNTFPFLVDCEFFSNVFFREGNVNSADLAAFLGMGGIEQMSDVAGGVRLNSRLEKDIVSCMMDGDPQALLKVLTYELTREIKAKVEGGMNG